MVEKEIKLVDTGIPTISDLEINSNISNILSSEEYIKKMNELVIKDEQERYIRALLNRLNKITKYMTKFVNDTETGGIHPGLVIDIAMGNDVKYWEAWLDKDTYNMLKKGE